MTLRIKDIMKLKGIKQAHLAVTLDISPGYLSLLMNNQRNPSPAMLSRIAKALEVNVPDLFVTDDAEMSGFREPQVAPITMTQHDADRLCRALGVTAKHPSFYDLSLSAPAFALTKGDRLAVDLNAKPSPGDLVIATVMDPHNASGSTSVYRWLEQWLLPSDPTETPVKMSDDGAASIVGRVCGIARAL